MSYRKLRQTNHSVGVWGCLALIEADHRVTDNKEFGAHWRHTGHAQWKGCKSHEHYMTQYSPLIRYIIWIVQNLTCHRCRLWEIHNHDKQQTADYSRPFLGIWSFTSVCLVLLNSQVRGMPSDCSFEITAHVWLFRWATLRDLYSSVICLWLLLLTRTIRNLLQYERKSIVYFAMTVAVVSNSAKPVFRNYPRSWDLSGNINLALPGTST